jgi:homoserine dehydrogenase
MKTIHLIQFGLGGVGRAVVQRVMASRDEFEWRYGLQLVYVAISDSRSAAIEPDGFSYAQLLTMMDAKAAGLSLADTEIGYDRGELTDIIDVAGTDETIVIDVTATDDTSDALLLALEMGYSAALANKKPLAGPHSRFRDLTASGQLRYESTVGSGVPIIATLRESIIASHDAVHRIDGCFSGTLGFLTTGLEEGKTFSELVTEARTLGYTEPDPRDDLGGMDVARKALILARTLGWPLELEHIPVAPLFPPEMTEGSVDEFMAALPQLDDSYRKKVAAAREQDKTLRYVATLSGGGASVGLQEIPIASALGQLRGADNIISFHTEVYNQTPLVLQGRGAGVHGTAAGVLADIVALGRDA